MPERIFFFVVVLILFHNGEIFGQEKNVEKFTTSPLFPVVHYPKSGRVSDSLHLFRQAAAAKTLINYPVYPLSNAGVISSFNPAQLSFFCRKERQFEKATSIPLKFRLGSLAYTDYLERKPNALKPGN
jgi:hypothetical protein